MIREQIIIQNKAGLHVRAAAKLVDVAKKFSSRIELICHERSGDAKSIMSLITLGAQKDNIINIVINGEDEEEAFNAIKHLIDDKFGENE